MSVAREVAEDEFARICDTFDLDVDVDAMDDDDKKSFPVLKERIVGAIESGHVTVAENGEPSVHLKCPVGVDGQYSVITFHEPRGASFLAMDGKKKGHDASKMFSLMADMAKVPGVVFSDMKNRDLKVCQALVTLFLA